MALIRHNNTKRRRDQNRAADQRRGSARERGYSTEWDKFARGWLCRNPLCVYCAAQDRVASAELVDHIVPHSGDPETFWPSPGENWQAFFASCCRSCHDGDKQRAEAYARRTGQDIRLILARRMMLKLDHPALAGIEVDRQTVLRHQLRDAEREKRRKIQAI